MNGCVGFEEAPRPWSMICRSCAGVSLLAFFRAGTNGETPPRPSRPWHCAQAKLTKSCAPEAIFGSTVWLAAVVLGVAAAVVPLVARPRKMPPTSAPPAATSTISTTAPAQDSESRRFLTRSDRNSLRRWNRGLADQDGHRGELDERLGDAAQHRAGNGAETARAHDDHVRVAVDRGTEDLLDDVAFGDVRIGVDADLQGVVQRLVEGCAGAAELAAEPALVERAAEQRDAVPDVDERDGRAGGGGELEPVEHGRL